MNYYSYPYHMTYYQPQYNRQFPQYSESEELAEIGPRQPLPSTSEITHHQVDFGDLRGASLWWNSEIRHLSVATANIGELKRVISHELRRMGFLNVGISKLDVSGGKDDCTVSIAHLHIADRRFWEVVMCSCNAGTGEKAKHIVNEVVAMLRRLRFL
jgi:hypothetical protein